MVEILARFIRKKTIILRTNVKYCYNGNNQ